MQNVELNEYRRFLWQRLLKVVVAHQTPELAGLRDYIYSLTPEHAGQLFALCRRVVSEIAALPPQKVGEFSGRVLEHLDHNLSSSAAGRLKRRYECFLRPSIRLFDAETCDILREFTPLFSEYQDRLQAYCDAMLHRLSSRRTRRCAPGWRRSSARNSARIRSAAASSPPFTRCRWRAARSIK